MTQIWYAASRNGLTIPFPIRTVYKTEMPTVEHEDLARDTRKAIESVPVFIPLDAEELESLSRDATLQTYARGEQIVRQGEAGDALYVIRSGRARVTVRGDDGQERDVAHLERGEYFGEMSLLTGEPRTASVLADEDLSVLVVYKEALASLLREALDARPGDGGNHGSPPPGTRRRQADRPRLRTKRASPQRRRTARRQDQTLPRDLARPCLGHPRPGAYRGSSPARRQRESLCGSRENHAPGW